jgi:NAD(P)-dependent dehydrogenase (short-subunit alcohol dehydrogenase family)
VPVSAISWQPFGTVTAEGFDATFNVNVRDTLFIVQKALAFLRDHASIILNGAEGNGGRGFPTITVYAASKAALRSFAHTWTSALRDRKICANVLNSGGIAAAAQDLLPPDAQEIYAEDGSLRKLRW